MTFTIRRLDEADLDAFTQIRGEALQRDPYSFGSSYEEFQKSLPFLKDRLKAQPHAFVLGCFAPELVGIVGFVRHDSLKTRHKGFIWGMYVARPHRGHGIGRALMEQAINEVRTMPGVETIGLTVVSSREPARKLYLSLGFTVYGVEKKALKIDDLYLDEELMVLDL